MANEWQTDSKRMANRWQTGMAIAITADGKPMAPYPYPFPTKDRPRWHYHSNGRPAVSGHARTQPPTRTGTTRTGNHRSVRTGHLDALEIADRRDIREGAAQRSRRRFWSAHDWALRHGFSDDQAPFAAVAANSIQSGLHGRVLTSPELVSQTRGRCREQWPVLFGVRS